jgi:dolichyl-phosphate-mannose--protein O-mannosyl transferase
MRGFGLSILSSLTAAILFMSDSALNVEGRFIVTDGFLHTFTVFAISTVPLSDYFSEFTLPWFLCLAISSLTLAFAISVKQTAYSLYVFFIYHHIVSLLRVFDSFITTLISLAIRLFVLLAISLLFHWSTYAFHMILLPYRGPGSTFLPDWWQGQLVDPPGPRRSLDDGIGPCLWAKVAWYYRVLHASNMLLNGSHPFGSKWSEWPFLTGHNVGFYDRGGRKILAVGNPMLWIPLAYFVIGITATAIPFLFLGGLMNEKTVDAIGFVVGYWASFLPFAFVPRTLHLYHYLVPLIFLILSFVAFVEAVLNLRAAAFTLVTFSMIAILGFVLFFPIQYGIETQDPGFMIWKTYS